MNRWSRRWRLRWRRWRLSPDVLTFWLLLTGWWCWKCCHPDSSHSRSQCESGEADWPARSGCPRRPSCLCCPPRRTSCTCPPSSPPVTWSATAGRRSPWSPSWLCVSSVFESSISSGGRRACWVLLVCWWWEYNWGQRDHLAVCLSVSPHRLLCRPAPGPAPPGRTEGVRVGSSVNIYMNSNNQLEITNKIPDK